MRLTESSQTLETNVRFDYSLSEKKTYIHGNMFGIDASSIRFIVQPEKRLINERCIVRSAIYWPT